MGWWTEPAFSKKKPDNSKDRGGKCIICKKYRCQCSREEQRAVKIKAQVKDKKGHTRTVTRNADWTEDKRGNNWCTKCNSRVINGKCMNITCSTRQ